MEDLFDFQVNRCPVFKPHQLKIMQRAIHEGFEKNKEMGFNMTVLGPDDIIFDKYCEGEACQITLPRRGSGFHVHPSFATNVASPQDLMSAFRNRESLMCIGGHSSWKASAEAAFSGQKAELVGVNCYVPKHHYDDPKAGELKELVSMVKKASKPRTDAEATSLSNLAEATIRAVKAFYRVCDYEF